MAAKLYNKRLEDLTNLVDFKRDFIFTLCVLHFVFCPVAVVGNLLIIRALWKASSIPANVRKLFLSLAFSDLAVRIFSQPMTAGDYNFGLMCPTDVTVYFFNYIFYSSSFLNVTAIAVDRLIAVLLHLRYQELVTSKHIIIALVSLWLPSAVVASIYILLPKRNDIILVIILKCPSSGATTTKDIILCLSTLFSWFVLFYIIRQQYCI